MNENINLCELLKGHEGEIFYSPLYGDVKFNLIDEDGYIEIIKPSMNSVFSLEKTGKFCDEGECVIFPSKDQRDWDKWAEEQAREFISYPENVQLIKDFYQI